MLPYRQRHDYTDQQLECLDILQEEAAEIIQAISKIKRQHWSIGPSYNPSVNGMILLNRELIDFNLVLDKAYDIKAIIPLSFTDTQSYRNAKIAKLMKWSNIYEVQENVQPRFAFAKLRECWSRWIGYLCGS